MGRAVFFLIGLALVYGGWWLYRRNQRIQATWQAITAEVVQMVRIPKRKRRNGLKAVYRYHKDGREFFGQCVNGRNADASVGSRLEILVDPDDASKSHARVDLSLIGPSLLGGFGVFIMAMAFFADHN